jgi:hypothetical protein
MSDAEHFLSFSTAAAGEQLFIHADAAGLDTLIRSLTRLREKLSQGISDHDHLMTETWAGNELSRPPLAAEEQPIEHVKVWAWTPDKLREHHLKA